jgi:hypothetical protein
MLPVAFVAHQAGERLRLRIPARKGDAAFFERAERDLAACPGVAYAEANPLTASILLHFHGDLDELASAASAGQLFTLEPPRMPEYSVLDVVADRVDRIEHFIQRRSQGALDLETILFLGLVGAGVVQLARGQALGPASTLLANAATILAVHRHRRDRGR